MMAQPTISLPRQACWCPCTTSGQVMDLLKSVHGRRDALVPRLELKREIQRVVPRLVQVAAVKPQRRLLGRLPHVPLFALTGTWVLGRVRPQPPDLADLVRSEERRV